MGVAEVTSAPYPDPKEDNEKLAVCFNKLSQEARVQIVILSNQHRPAPTNAAAVSLSTTAATGALKVSFTAPANNGGSPITACTVGSNW